MLMAMMPVIACAATETSSVTYDIRTLTSLFDASLKKESPDTYIEKRLTDERSDVRALAEKEVKNLAEKTVTDAQELPSIDRQRAVVAAFEEHLRDLSVDLDLLTEEEKTYYKEGTSGTGATTDDMRTTVSHGQLLAKKAVAEERIVATENALSLQKDRLQKLVSQERTEQFLGAFRSLSYLIIILAAVLLDRIIRRRIIRRFQDKSRRYVVAKAVSASIYALAIIIVVARLLSDHPEALSSLAIIGAGIAIALQDVIKDMVSWLIIMQRRLYRLGDRITVGTFTGDVVDIGLLRTTLLDASAAAGAALPAHEHTGKLLVVPNSILLREPVSNFSAASDYVSAEISLTIAYTAEWRAVQSILESVLEKEAATHSEQARKQQRRRTSLYYTSWEAGPPTVHVSVGSSGIIFTLTFLAPIGKRREIQTTVSKRILEAILAQYDITTKDNIMTLTRRV